MAVESLQKQLQRIFGKIQDAANQTLADDVFPLVKNEMGLAIQREVYGKYNPDVYKRRGASGGLADTRNIVGGVLNGKLIVVNKTPPNTDRSSYRTSDNKHASIVRNAQGKDLSGVIERGDPGIGLYDFPKQGENYMQPRPFIEATRDAVASKWLNVFKRGMARRGFKLVKNLPTAKTTTTSSRRGIDQYQERMSKSMLEKYMRSRNFSTYAKTNIRDDYINKGLSLAEAEARASHLSHYFSSFLGSKFSMYKIPKKRRK